MAGGIPLIRALRESLAGERIHRVMGIVNGTTNYILTRMAAPGASYQEALSEAQSLGYAERDPTADVEGYDAAAKAAILANVAFGAKVVAGDVYREGISALTGRTSKPPSGSDLPSSCWQSSRPAPTARSVSASTRPWSPRTILWPRCGTRSTPFSSRATPSAS